MRIEELGDAEEEILEDDEDDEDEEDDEEGTRTPQAAAAASGSGTTAEPARAQTITSMLIREVVANREGHFGESAVVASAKTNVLTVYSHATADPPIVEPRRPAWDLHASNTFSEPKTSGGGARG